MIASRNNNSTPLDALRNLGRTCGYIIIATASLTAGLATASLTAGLATASLMRRHSLPGKVLLFRGGEGYLGGQTVLLSRDAYTPVDISLISHPSMQHNNLLVRTTAFASLSAPSPASPTTIQRTTGTAPTPSTPSRACVNDVDVIV